MTGVAKWLLITPCVLGLALHVVTFFKGVQASDGLSLFGIGLLIWSWWPYLACLGLRLVRTLVWPVFLASLLALGADAFMFWNVFIDPKGSTAAIGLIFMPLWNMIVILPGGIAVGWAIGRLGGIFGQRRRPR